MTTVPATISLDEVVPRTLSRRSTGADAVFKHGARVVGASVLVITGGVGLFLAWQAYPTLRRYGWSFFTESQWQPDQDVIGIAAVLVGTVSVALVAMTIAFPAPPSITNGILAQRCPPEPTDPTHESSRTPALSVG